ncbi:MAG: metallophosphoesterase [Kiritimatiellaeota bacterium]|nr:metallophosphoesterase [Kiritimatiellota bacterium]
MPLDILILADLHYPFYGATGAPYHGDKARLFFQKALRKLRHENITPGLIVLLGDLLDDPAAPDADFYLSLLAEEILKPGIPVLAIPGNHDNAARVAEIFNCPPGLHIVNGVGFLLFHDTFERKTKRFIRSKAGLALPEKTAREHPGLPLIALQHPALASVVPKKYRLENAADALDSLAAANVLASFSGHAHETHSPGQHGPVAVHTLPAFCEPPFAFLHVRVDGAEVAATRHALKLPDAPPLADTHSHSAFAMCANNINVADNIRVADVLGLHTLAVTEHAFQLYFPPPIAWSFQWVDDPAHAEAAWQTPGRGRMAAYKSFIQTHRRKNILLGLELELHDNGKLLLHPGDRDGWDIFLGAMHRIQGAAKGMPPADIEALYMRDLDALCGHPIHILAHPLRIFKSYNTPPPVHLYDDIARRLAKAGVAAEMNFHDTPPDPAFVTACLRRGVKLSLGTDTHSQPYIADLHPHLKLLGELGVKPGDFPRVLLDISKGALRRHSHGNL